MYLIGLPDWKHVSTVGEAQQSPRKHITIIYYIRTFSLYVKLKRAVGHAGWEKERREGEGCDCLECILQNQKSAGRLEPISTYCATLTKK